MENFKLKKLHTQDMHIQPHGYTFLLNEDYEVINYSKNIDSLDGFSSEEIINKPLKSLVDEQSWQNFHDSIEEQKGYIYNGFDIYFKRLPDRKFDASIFYDGKNRLLEFEPALSNRREIKHLNKWILNAGNILQSIDKPEDLYQTTLDILNEVIGYEKAFFLKYNEVYDAKIVGEINDENDESFLNFNLVEYDGKPGNSKTSILDQIRYIPNTSYHLSFQSEYANEKLKKELGNWYPPEKLKTYLQEYGVCSYISFSIRVNDKIWGKAVFYNSTEKRLRLKQRETAVSVFQQISNVAGMKLLQQLQQREVNFQTMHARIASAMASHDDFTEGIKKESDSLLRMTNATGMVWNIGHQLFRFGTTPDDDSVNKIIQWIHASSEGNENIFHTHCLSILNDEFESILQDASGIFYLNISPQDHQYIIWFRKEKVITTLQPFSSGNGEFSVQNFEHIHKRGYSDTWNKGDIDNAVKLKNSIANYIIQSSERLKRQNELLEKLILERTQSLQKEIKKRKKAEEKMLKSVEELKRSNHELENFAYVASHDLQEPLRKIQAFSDRLKKVLTDQLDERAFDYFNRLTNAAERMQKLINDLLSYSRVTTHAKPFIEVNMDEMLEGVISDLNVKITENNAEIRVDKIGVIHGDEHQLRRLFQNLIQNALKFHKPGISPIVEIINKSSDDRCIISVKDNGIGFEENYADKIFELFERLHGRGDYEGTGLGLAICKKIVERHNGNISTNSKPGEGAEFTISLPFKQ